MTNCDFKFILDVAAFSRKVLAMPSVRHALTQGTILALAPEEARILHRVCEDVVRENSEPYALACSASIQSGNPVELDPDLFEAAYAIDMTRAIIAVQLPRLIEAGRLLDVNALGDDELLSVLAPTVN